MFERKIQQNIITLKKSLFKKVLAARTVTKQKERQTNKTRRRCVLRDLSPFLIKFFIPSKHDSSNSISVSLIGLSLAGSS
jgi:hypothetical protein